MVGQGAAAFRWQSSDRRRLMAMRRVQAYIAAMPEGRERSRSASRRVDRCSEVPNESKAKRWNSPS